MKLIITAFIILISVSCAANDSISYFSCSGFSGTAERQSKLPIENRTITANKSEISGSISIDAKHIAIEGIPLMTGPYEICQSSDQAVMFAPACYPGEPDKFGDFGVLNKVTGRVLYHVGDALFILNCHKAKKVVK